MFVPDHVNYISLRPLFFALFIKIHSFGPDLISVLFNTGFVDSALHCSEPITTVLLVKEVLAFVDGADEHAVLGFICTAIFEFSDIFLTALRDELFDVVHFLRGESA